MLTSKSDLWFWSTNIFCRLIWFSSVEDKVNEKSSSWSSDFSLNSCCSSSIVLSFSSLTCLRWDISCWSTSRAVFSKPTLLLLELFPLLLLFFWVGVVGGFLVVGGLVLLLVVVLGWLGEDVGVMLRCLSNTAIRSWIFFASSDITSFDSGIWKNW